MKKIFVLVLYLLSFASLAYANDSNARLMRTPDYTEGKIVFSYQDDLWIYNENTKITTRLTSHQGLEEYPKFSPDGKYIAFTGNYNGQRAIFIIPSEGGEPKQLTYYPDYDPMVVAWAPDSKSLTFTSRKDSFAYFFTKFYEVSIQGEYPKMLPIDKGSFLSYSPDGKKLVYNNHPSTYWWWKRYKGSANQDIYLYDKETKKFTQLTDYSGNDIWPMWAKDNKIYFVSDRDGIPNIYSLNLKNKDIKKITFHKFDGVKWPSIGTDRQTIVYEFDGKIYKLDTISNKYQEVPIDIYTDNKYDTIEFINPSKNINSYDISPTGKRLLLEARGEVFSVPVQEGTYKNYTNSSNARDKYPTWSPNGKYITYISDESGEEQLYIINQQTEEKIQLTNDKNFKFYPKWSPDSKKILYSTQDNYLNYVDISTKQTVNVAIGKYNRIYDYEWAPDSNWIVYQYINKNAYSDICVYSLENKSTNKITKGDAYYSEPVFTKDGKSLLFFRTFSRGWTSLKEMESYGTSFRINVPTKTSILSVSLLPETKDPYEKEEDIEPIEEEKKEEKKTSENTKKELKVTIDFKNIFNRIRPLPIPDGPYYGLLTTNKYYYFLKINYEDYLNSDDPWESDVSPVSLVSYDIDKQKIEEVAKNIKSYTISSKEAKIVTWDGKNFYAFGVGQRPTRDSLINISNILMKLDRKAEWEQIFNECYRVIKYYFYDPNYHGVKWDKIKEYYSQFLPYIKTRNDLNYILNQMVGELNASHQGVSGGDWHSTKWYPTALLGAELEPDYNAGYYKFTKIYKGDKVNNYISPLDNEFVNIKVGDYLIAIDNTKIDVKENYLKYLINKRGKITLTTNSKPSEQGAIKTVIKPIYWERKLKYKEWLDKNISYVEKNSNNKIGYLHLQAMGLDDMDVFDKYFQFYRDKEGLIIDVRYNGGGNIDTLIMDKLERVPYMTEKSRASEQTIRPSNSFLGKIVVLINEYSYSDAEVFARAFQIRKLGKVIGIPTLGYCISVVDHKLIDNGNMRKTIMGIWDLWGNMIESKGVIPDIYVANPPEAEVQGKDLQLQKAVEYLNSEIKKSPKKTNYPQPIAPR